MDSVKNIWLDVDPGHDDATAILMALHTPSLHLLGVSTTHGNAAQEYTSVNAARCLFAFHAPAHVRVYPGAPKPLIRTARYAPSIHGIDGLGGVQGLPDANDPRVQALFATEPDGSRTHALPGMASHIKRVWKDGTGSKITVIATGPLTNIALFIAVYPDLLEAIEIVFMGGAVGLGNWSSVAEFNIVCDPHACQMVLDAPVPKIMVPLNVTHTAIVTRKIHAQMLDPQFDLSSLDESTILPSTTSNLRHTLSTLVTFFADAYRDKFNFLSGPPLHDALTIAFVSRPDLFTTCRKRVDVELSGTHSFGETVVDVWDYRDCDDSWGVKGRNCLVAQDIQVSQFFDLFLECISRCDAVSPLNTANYLLVK